MTVRRNVRVYQPVAKERIAPGAMASASALRDLMANAHALWAHRRRVHGWGNVAPWGRDGVVFAVGDANKQFALVSFHPLPPPGIPVSRYSCYAYGAGAGGSTGARVFFSAGGGGPEVTQANVTLGGAGWQSTTLAAQPSARPSWISVMLDPRGDTTATLDSICVVEEAPSDDDLIFGAAVPTAFELRASKIVGASGIGNQDMPMDVDILRWARRQQAMLGKYRPRHVLNTYVGLQYSQTVTPTQTLVRRYRVLQGVGEATLRLRVYARGYGAGTKTVEVFVDGVSKGTVTTTNADNIGAWMATGGNSYLDTAFPAGVGLRELTLKAEVDGAGDELWAIGVCGTFLEGASADCVAAGDTVPQKLKPIDLAYPRAGDAIMGRFQGAAPADLWSVGYASDTIDTPEPYADPFTLLRNTQAVYLHKTSTPISDWGYGPSENAQGAGASGGLLQVIQFPQLLR